MSRRSARIADTPRVQTKILDYSSGSDDDENDDQLLQKLQALHSSRSSGDEEEDDEMESISEEGEMDETAYEAKQQAKRQKVKDKKRQEREERRKILLTSKADSAEAALSAPYPILIDGMTGVLKSFFYLTEEGDITTSTSPFFLINESMLIRLLNTKTESGDFVLSFLTLGKIAASCQAWWYLFFDPKYQFWYKLIQERIVLDMNEPPRPMTLKHRDLVNSFIADMGKKHLRIYTQAFIAYANVFSAGECTHCGMYTSLSQQLHRSKDVIPLSSFRVETPEEAKAPLKLSSAEENAAIRKFYNELPPEEMKRISDTATPPMWIKILLTVRNACKHRYHCVYCNAILDKEICGLPASLIYSACGERKNKKSHSWKSLDAELIGPDNAGIPGSYLFCTICGVLSYNVTESLFEKFPCGQPSCFANKVCTCVPCELCGKNDELCRCIICETCERCQEDRCSKECRKKCKCD